MPNFSYLSKHWDIYTYPWRPNHDFLLEIDKYILWENQKILVLGSTKEFRSKYKNHNITICDISIDMMLWNDVWNKNENKINSNWLDLDNEKYDIILWDLIFFLLDHNQLKLLFSKIKSKLSNNWKFIFRTAFQNKSENDDLLIRNFYKLKNDKLRFNYLSFELVIWRKFKWEDINNFIKEYNLDFNDFSLIYQKFTPYNTSKINIENKSNFDIILSDFNIDKSINKNFVLLQEYIYIISNRNA